MSLTGTLQRAGLICARRAWDPVVAAMVYSECGILRGALLSPQKGFLAEQRHALGAGLCCCSPTGEMRTVLCAWCSHALTPLVLCPLGTLAARARARAWGLVPLAALAVCAPLCMARCAAVPLMDVSREEMPQTQFAQIMAGAEQPTLLDWTSLDQGFYLAAGITPTCRYFVNNNLNTEEKRLAYEAAVASGDMEFMWSTLAGLPARDTCGSRRLLACLIWQRAQYALYRYMGEASTWTRD